ncbi:MAG TPA: hypothetical protein DIT04_12885 [Dysgonomonas sp.]|nr:hypothetical protein [Dysgonomonas sp.]
MEFKRVDKGTDIDMLSVKDAMPIELCEDVLVKCGFVNSGKEGTTCYYRHLDTSICIVKERDRYSFRYTDKIGDFTLRNNVIVPIEYLHQLQNLHYFITGKELDIAM